MSSAKPGVRQWSQIQPGLRPDAPYPTVRRSSSVTRMPSRAQKYAVAQPTIPPPTTMTE